MFNNLTSGTPMIGGSSADRSDAEQKSRKESKMGDASNDQAHRAHRLLVFEHDPEATNIIVKLAERCHFETFATTDGRGVMNLVSALEPQILVIGLGAPNANASELLSLLASSGYQGLCIIVCEHTPPELARVCEHCRAAGLNEPTIIFKPIDKSLLRDLLVEYGHGLNLAA
ncbi:MAG: hypothetical protein AAFY99_07440 [Pseudomonadota bacterium]